MPFVTPDSDAEAFVTPDSDVIDTTRTPQGIQSSPAPQPVGWREALFPNTVRGKGSLPLRLAGDVLGGPGRFAATMIQQDAGRGSEGGPTFLEDLSRTEGEPGVNFVSRTADTMVRDPVNIPLALATAATGGLAAPAWLARLGWLGKGLQAGVPAGATIAAGRQAGNLANARPLSGSEAAVDVGLGTLLGVGGSAAGRAMEGAGKLAVPAMMKLSKVKEKWREGVREALPEMIRRGLLAPTVGGIERNLTRLGNEAKALYQTATAGTEGIPAVSLMSAADDAAMNLQRGADRGGILREFEDPITEWIQGVASRPLPATGAASAGMVDVPTAIASRSAARTAAGSYESGAPKSVARELRQQAADDYAKAINSRLDVVAPAVREADAFAAPYYKVRPLMDALGARSSNYEVGLTELGAGAIGSELGQLIAGGTAPGAVAMGALARLQRSPALPWALNEIGKRAGAPASAARIGQYLFRAPTDNVRGR